MNQSGTVKSCHWEITKKCNLNCLHCISFSRNKQELGEQSVLRAIDVLKSWGCKEINFTGGEPLIRKDIFDIFKKAKEKKIKIGLLSNGTLINTENIEKIKSYVSEMGISLDGASAEINDKIRGRGSFNRILSAIKLVKNYKIPITLYITICKLNSDDFGNILKLAKLTGVDNVRVNEITLRGKARVNKKMLKFDKAKKSDLKNHLLNMLKDSYYCNGTILFDSSCEIDSKNIFISPPGHIYPCVEIYQWKPNWHMGNILKVDRSKNLYKQMKSKPKKCPYQFAVANNFTLCLNNTATKCDYGY